MTEYENLLSIAKLAVQEAIKLLVEMSHHREKFDFCDDVPREMKAEADRVVESVILNILRTTDVKILSEESGEENDAGDSQLRWVVDPIDGTVNFIRLIAPSAVSIGLWKDEKPIFGVVGEYPSGTIYWGGHAFGAFANKDSIRVSSVKDASKAVLCSGFPSRFDFSSKSIEKSFEIYSDFGKVRMLGAASLSILQVARGSADAYIERDIMIWDVAAALAILQGAGGEFSISPGRFENSHDIFASNCLIELEK
jgi:myo-inositol-1(or 4)-monophosphatase